MRSPRLYQVFLVTSLVVAAACDSNTKAPVAPDGGPAAFNIVNVAAQCSNTQKNLISSEIKNLYTSNTDKNEASKRLQTITGNCVLSDPTKLHQAGADDIAYVAFFLSKVPSLALGHTDWAQHLNDVLLYAFGRVYGPTNKGIVASSFEQYGAIQVCGSGGCLLQDQSGSFKLRVNAGTIGTNTSFSQYLFTFAPVANSNCQHETLDFHGPCHDVAVNPFTTFPSPYVTVSACTADLEATGSLAHEFNLALPTPAHTDNSSFVTLPPAAATALAVTCNNVPGDFDGLNPPVIGSLGTRGVFAMLRDGMTQVGNKALGFLSPTPAYAIHVFGSDISAFCDPDQGCAPVGNVDPLTFLGTFSSGAFGFPPPTQAEKGTWTSFASAPGTITVQQSLGNLTDRVVVLSQGGGNCSVCGGLQLTGTLATTTPGVYPANGTHQVVWSSLQDAPTVKQAPFVLRGSDGKEIAALTYAQVQSSQILTFTYKNGNNVVTETVGNWVRDVAQTFTITVDLANKTVTLTGPGLTTKTGGFVQAATDFKQWAAEFTGIDAGVMAVDNVQIIRLQSTTP
jgi:hypothetical protein